MIGPVEADTAPEAAGELEVRETTPPATAVLALVIERIGVALLTELPLEAVAMLTAVAPVLERTMFWELYVPGTAAFAAKRMRSEPLADPLVCVKVAVEPYVVPSAETSNPVGAVATKFAVRPAPETGKDCTPETVP